MTLSSRPERSTTVSADDAVSTTGSVKMLASSGNSGRIGGTEEDLSSVAQAGATQRGAKSDRLVTQTERPENPECRRFSEDAGRTRRASADSLNHRRDPALLSSLGHRTTVCPAVGESGVICNFFKRCGPESARLAEFSRPAESDGLDPPDDPDRRRRTSPRNRDWSIISILPSLRTRKIEGKNLLLRSAV